MKYIYKNETDRSINIGGYQFNKGGELSSDIVIERFNEAVSNKFLSLRKVIANEEIATKIIDKKNDNKDVKPKNKVKLKEENVNLEADKALSGIDEPKADTDNNEDKTDKDSNENKTDTNNVEIETDNLIKPENETTTNKEPTEGFIKNTINI